MTALVALASAASCSKDDGDGGGDGDLGGAPGQSAAGGTMSDIDLPGGDGDGGDGDGDGLGGQGMTGEIMIIETLPTGFTPGMVDPTAQDSEPARGGYRLVGRLDEIEDFEQAECANVLRGITRDFDDTHPDFGEEKADGPGFVETELGEDRKPVHTSDDSINTEINALDEWYVSNEALNRSYVVDIWLEPEGDSFVFDSGLYFPVDGEGDDATYEGKDGEQHNFLFTTELHTSFVYEGGEFFTFRGDDDVWVFINGRLAVDLGGIHGPQTDSIDLDQSAGDLGLEVGQTYALDLFHAERRQFGSNFRIETTLNFTGCGEILPDDVVR